MKVIELTKNKVALVDDEDYEFINSYKWYTKKYAHSNRYCAITTITLGRGVKTREKMHVSMHRLIMKAPSHLQVDHINNDPLDNRKCNLRFCTNEQNKYNIPKSTSKTYTSQYKGVRKRRNSWEANIRIKGKSLYLGSYKTEVEAFEAYKKEAIKYHGEFLHSSLLKG